MKSKTSTRQKKNHVSFLNFSKSQSLSFLFLFFFFSQVSSIEAIHFVENDPEAIVWQIVQYHHINHHLYRIHHDHLVQLIHIVFICLVDQVLVKQLWSPNFVLPNALMPTRIAVRVANAQFFFTPIKVWKTLFYCVFSLFCQQY